jgi:hypothetical protein
MQTTQLARIALSNEPQKPKIKTVMNKAESGRITMKKALLAICVLLLLAVPATVFASGEYGFSLVYHEVDASGNVIGEYKPDLKQMVDSGKYYFTVKWADGHLDEKSYRSVSITNDYMHYYVWGYPGTNIIERPVGIYTILEYPVPEGYVAADKNPITADFINDGMEVYVDVYIRKSAAAPNPASVPVPADVTFAVNSKPVDLKLPILNVNGRTMYPFRECMELIGAEVTWDAANRVAGGKLGDKSVEFTLDSGSYKSNGQTVQMDSGVTAFINNDRTYIPIRYAAESLGYQVTWTEKTKLINLTK